MTTVSRKKYECIKRKAAQWRCKALEANEEIGELRDMIERLSAHEKAIEDSKRLINKITLERDKLHKEIKTIQQTMVDESFKQKRELWMKNGEIDRLNLSLIDYKERYKEIREDNKELRKSVRTVSRV